MHATALYPFVPSGDNFDQSLAFFRELGFESAWQDDQLAGLRFGQAFFILQRIVVPEWQKNQMIVIEVNDLDAYWSALRAKDLSSRFPGARLARAPSEVVDAVNQAASWRASARRRTCLASICPSACFDG